MFVPMRNTAHASALLIVADPALNRLLKNLALFLLFAFLLALFPSHSSAQVLYGSLTGNVTDPSGAGVPNGKVAATNTETGVSASASHSRYTKQRRPWRARSMNWARSGMKLAMAKRRAD